MSPNYYDTSLVPFFVTWILGIERHNQNIIQTCKTGHPKPIFNSDKYFFSNNDTFESFKRQRNEMSEP